MSMTVGEICRSDPVTVDRDASLSEAAKGMVEHRASSVVVYDDERRMEVGIVTDTDVLRAGFRADRPLSEVPVEAVVSEGLVTIGADASVGTALERMRRESVSHLVVVEDGIEGILSTTDVALAHPEVDDGFADAANLRR